MPRTSDSDLGLLSAHLDQALELNEADREIWIAELRTKDAALAERVQRLLSNAQRSGFGEFLSHPAPRPTVDATAGLIGRSVGPYVIDAEIGRGGMGSVWRARRVDGRFEGVVAIKFVHTFWIGQSGEQRFRTEGQLLGRLDHPHIARLLDAGVLEGMQPYLVLEYVDGVAIDTYCESRSLGTEARIRLFLDVLAAVGHAHSNLIVHRDLKPSNIFVTGDGVVKLLDFGIAKLLDAGGSDVQPTQASASALTPQYAAPEQLLGQPVTTATDTYALGLVLYFLLTGSHPWKSGTRLQALELHSRATDARLRASSKAQLALVPGRSLEGDLDNILHKSLSADPVERYGSASDFAQDLQRFLDHMPVRARPDTLPYRTAKFVRRHRGSVAASALTLAAILAGLASTIWQARRADANAMLAAAQRERALQQLGYAEATNDFLGFLMRQGADHPFTTPELLARGELLIDREFNSDPALRTRMLLTLADLYGETGDETHAVNMLIMAQRAAQLSGDSTLRIEADCSLAHEYANARDFDKSQPLFNAAILRARAAPDTDTGVLAACLDERGDALVTQHDLGPALADARSALTLLGSPRPGQQLLATSARGTIATIYGLMGRSADAVREYRQALDELQRMGRGQSASAIFYYNQLAVALSRAGQWLSSAEVYRSGVAVARAIAGGGEVEPTMITNYAKLLTDLGRSTEAIELFEEAIASAEHHGNGFGVAMGNLLSAPAWCGIGDLSACATRLAQAQPALAKKLPPGHSTLGTVETEAASLALLQQRPLLALDHARRALQIFDAAKDRNPNALRALALLSEIELKLGDTTAATAYAAQAVTRVRQQQQGLQTSAWFGRAQLVQAEVYLAQGNSIRAAQSARVAADALRACCGEQAPWTRQVNGLVAGLSR